MRLHSKRDPLSARLRAGIRASVALALAVIVTIGATMSGRSYLWCIPMGRVMSACCLAAAASAEPEPARAPSIEMECCETRSFGHVTTGHPSAEPLDVPPALPAGFAPGFVRVADDARAIAHAPRRLGNTPLREIRAGPDGPLARCVALRVLHC